MKRNLERFVNFSDGVMAIAVTLMILPMADRAIEANVSSFSDFFETFGGSLVIFAISFWVVCRYWLVHHDIMSRVKTFDTQLFWINVAWLFAIVLVPFTSAFIGGGDSSDSFRVGVYVGSLVLISYVSIALDWSARRTAVALPEITQKTPSLGSAATAIGFTIALIVGVAIPSIGLWAILALLPANFVANSISKRQQKAQKV